MPTNFEPKRLKPKQARYRRKTVPENRVHRLTDSNGTHAVLHRHCTEHPIQINYDYKTKKALKNPSGIYLTISIVCIVIF